MYRKRVVFMAACAGMLLFGICLITLGSVAADLKEKLKLDAISAGALFSVLPLGILTGSLLFGPIADKYGYRILMAVSCLFMLFGFEGIAYSGSLFLLKVCIFFFGIGGGAINGSTNALISDLSDKDKGANLSLLGAFFGIGALGMPLISGILRDRLSFETILTAVGILTFASGIVFLLIKYPLPKQVQGFPLKQGLKLIRDNVLLVIAFFLFFQSGFEGIINNWTTTYLLSEKSLQQSNALFGLSSFVAGMTVMRLLSGSILRAVSVKKIMISSFIMVLLGLILVKSSNSFAPCITGLVILGAGLASGFPVMLGFVGEMYSEISGTAFSVVMFVALAGNTLINYGMGIVAQNFGTDHLITFAFAVTFIMILLCIIILKKQKTIK